MFMFMFANLSSDGTVDPVPVAIVADEAWDASTFKNVALRMVQLYEQRQQDIRKAEAQTLVNLSKVLGCGVEDLFD